MSIFLPKGVAKGEVLDPNKLSDDFVSASQIATNTTQHQWKSNAFFDSSSGEDRGDEDKLVKGGPVTIHEVKQEAWLRADSDSQRLALRTGATGWPFELDRGTCDPNLYHVPYMRDLTRIDDMTITWESSYPEVVWTIFSFQFAREAIQKYVWNDTAYSMEQEKNSEEYPNSGMIRLQVRISIDGSTPPGSGVYSKMLNQNFRGMGTAQPVFRSSINDMSFLPAGSHRVEALAAQENATMEFSETSTGLEALYDWAMWQGPIVPMSVVPDSGVCIGHRKLIVIRFPRGGDLGG